MQHEDRDALAAEYVLGTLSVEERDQAEALLARDAGFAETVRLWEHRLGELNVMVEAVEPPPDVWERIKTEIDGAERRSQASAETVELNGGGQSEPAHAAEAPISPAGPDANLESPTETVPDLLAEELQSSEDSPAAELGSALMPSASAIDFDDRQPRPSAPQSTIDRQGPASTKAGRWRALAIGATVVAGLLAIYIGIAQVAPKLIARQSQATATVSKPASGTQFVAVLQQEPTPLAFLVMFDPQQRTITIRRLTAAPENGRSYELWLYPSKSPKPIALGPVGGSAVTTRPIPQNIEVETMRGATYSVSLEPSGGSTSGTPTGPTLFKGQMIDTAAPGSSG